jgi:hypothetical protein
LGFGLWGFRFAVLGLGLLAIRLLVIDRISNPLRHTAFDGQSVSRAQTPLRADFAGGVRLYGYDLSATTLRPDETFDVSLYISVREPVARRYWPAFTVEDGSGLTWLEDAVVPRWHREPPHTPLWPPGMYAQWARRVSFRPGTPPGTYHLFGSVFDLDSLQVASMLDAVGNAIAPRFTLGTLTVTRPRAPLALHPEHETPHPFGPLALLGYNLDRTKANAGEAVLLTLYWRSEAATRTDYAARVVFLDPTGATALGVDVAPANAYPTSHWQPGDQWRGQARIRLPASLAEGAYQLSLSVNGEPGAQALGTIHVTAPTRTFTRPDVSTASGAEFQSLAVLEGYTLQRADDALTIALVWRATHSPEVSYAAFVHLSDGVGRIWAQSDAVPANWTRPTTGWLPGEYILDTHTLTLPDDLPAGEYVLRVGLYDPQTGARVPAAGAGAGADQRVEIGSISLPR